MKNGLKSDGCFFTIDLFDGLQCNKRNTFDEFGFPDKLCTEYKTCKKIKRKVFEYKKSLKEQSNDKR